MPVIERLIRATYKLLATATLKGAALACAFAGILVAAIVGHAAFSAKAENAAMVGVSKCRTGIGELDRVLGGGIVAGSLSLVGGDPGGGGVSKLAT